MTPKRLIDTETGSPSGDAVLPAPATKTDSFPAGHCFVRQGEPFQGLFFLAEGELTIVTPGREAVTYSQPQSCLDAQIEVIKDGIWQANVLTDDGASVKVLDYAELHRLVRTFSRERSVQAARAESLTAELTELQGRYGSAVGEKNEWQERYCSVEMVLADFVESGAAGSIAVIFRDRVAELEEDYYTMADSFARREQQVIEAQAARQQAEEALIAAEARIEMLEAETIKDPFETALSEGLEQIKRGARIRQLEAELIGRDRRIGELEAEVRRYIDELEGARRLAANELGKIADLAGRRSSPSSPESTSASRLTPEDDAVIETGVSQLEGDEGIYWDDEADEDGQRKHRTTMIGVAPQKVFITPPDKK